MGAFFGAASTRSDGRTAGLGVSEAYPGRPELVVLDDTAAVPLAWRRLGARPAAARNALAKCFFDANCGTACSTANVTRLAVGATGHSDRAGIVNLGMGVEGSARRPDRV